MFGGSVVVARQSQRRGKHPVHAGVLMLLALTALALAPSSADADRSVRLRATFEGQQATATFSVPDEWTSDTRASGVRLTAPSSRDGCTHVLQLDVDLLYVALTLSSADWVISRLIGQGTLVAGAPGAYSWGVAAPKGARTSTGAAARAAGTGRYGLIMSEIRSSADVSRGCPSSQGARAAKRLARVLQGLVLTTAKRRR
ncbi:MAG: hypothetical protein JWO02_3077 [Solirubrobacterales bacterium]|nr:hypothetical protein [Solirubrobacterales bacterium]